MTHVTCRLTAKNRDQLRNPTHGNRVWATFTLFDDSATSRFAAKLMPGCPSNDVAQNSKVLTLCENEFDPSISFDRAPICGGLTTVGFKCVESMVRIIIRGPYPLSNTIIYMHLQ